MTVRSKGRSKVILVEMSDFHCPFCARYSTETYPEIQRNFVDNGLIAYGFQNFPMERLHPYAVRAAIAIECAGGQGRFWEMHDKLFSSQKTLSDSTIGSIATELALAKVPFKSCFDSPMTESKVRTQLKAAEEAGVTSTPTFLIGTLDSEDKVQVRFRILGAQPYGVFSQTLKKALDNQQ